MFYVLEKFPDMPETVFYFIIVQDNSKEENKKRG